jgi:hypothetical protein
MTPRGIEGVLIRALVIVCGLAAVALVTAAMLLVVRLNRTGPGTAVTAAPRTATGSVDARERARRTAARRAAALQARVPEGRLFARTSFWNRRLSAAIPLDPSSTVLVQALVAEVDREQQADSGPSIRTSESSTPLYRVGPSQERVRVRLDAPRVPGSQALRRAFARVPIPADAEPGTGRDRQMTIWQPSTDTLWEFLGARRRSDRWHAKWGGAIQDISESRGYYTAAAWPGARRTWGATASGLPVIGGTILVDEPRAGRIDHALALSVPAARAGAFAWPAQRTNGNGPLMALPEGARLRLDPQLNLRKLELPRLTRMIARAAQRYGLVVRDQTGKDVALFAEDPSPRRDHPYRRYFSRSGPTEVLARFPWDRLQVLPMSLCTNAPCGAP